MVGIIAESTAGIKGVLFYAMIYVFGNMGAFAVATLVAEKQGSSEIKDLAGFWRRSPLATVVMTASLLSLAGIPPLAGFVGKFYLFSALISTHYIWLAIVGVINSVVSLYYYAKVVRNMYLVEPIEKSRIEFDFGSNLLMTLLVVPNIALMLYFTPVLSWAQYSVTMFGLR